MKKGKTSELQIVNLLKEHAAGIPVQELSRKAGVSPATIYNWKAKYGAWK
ncbi:MAG: transposase [Sphingobacteriia bacterium]|jgi:putative transposase